MIDTTMIVRNDPRPILPSPPALNHNVNLSACLRSRSHFVTCGRLIQVLMKLAPRKNLHQEHHAGCFLIRCKISFLHKCSFLSEGRSFLSKDRALNWLCIGFELALFFLASQLHILAYQFINKSLTAFFQMLRLALFSQTNPFSNRPNLKNPNDEFFYEFGNNGELAGVFRIGKWLKRGEFVDRVMNVKNRN